MQINDGRVISNFIVQALKGQDITIFGDGTQTRSFCYVDDMVDGIISMMATNNSVTGPINLGNPYELEIKELAKKIIELTNSKSKIVFNKLPSDDPKQRCPNIDKAKFILNWQPNIKLEKGLINTIEYFKSIL